MKTVFLETFGCQMNVSDSERVSTLLSSKGWQIVDKREDADVVLINTCSVREKAEQKLYTEVGRLRGKAGKSPVIGVMGCVAQLEGETLFSRSPNIDFVIGTRAVGRVDAALERVERGERHFTDLGERELNYDWSVADESRHSRYVAFVPIIEGCNKFCTYCIVPFARGREVSIPAYEIIRQVLEYKRLGVKEIHLIGQNVNSYKPETGAGLEGFAGKRPFTRLLRAVAATGIERIKFSTSFPRDFEDEIIDAIEENENLCNWVHLPVQSGSNRILRLMRRLHTTERYKKRVDRIRNSKRNISLTTDIIVGFPGETEEDFQQTIELFNYAGFDSAYIFKYSPRFGTPAYSMKDDVSAEVKTERFLRLEAEQKRLQSDSLNRLVGQALPVLVEKVSARSENDLSGHTTCHRVVNFKGDFSLLGKIVNVRIIEAKSNSLYGEVEI
ncbi:MAG TPA: tRNA (N6-isopentenyl adenosine(37)-C2)-methylthiotransferase MiaB [Pyrinomonadaceae bacterium]|nr:tRNA (N6-isopentenyl adenosine(37)-C2)-methylthiotransferase MiaB [Pyrinomonadaceae bacterium]